MIGSDHHGIETRLHLGRLVESLGHQAFDVGPLSSQGSVDYPDVAAKVAEGVSRGEYERGILICGTGIGMSIVANKFPGVRAAPVADVFSAELSRRHNDLNVLCLSAELLTEETIDDVVRSWLNAQFSGEARHIRRLGLVAEIEREQAWKNGVNLEIEAE